jgi:hypothetical protein
MERQGAFGRGLRENVFQKKYYQKVTFGEFV